MSWLHQIFHFFALNRGSAKISKSVNYSPRLSRRATPKLRPLISILSSSLLIPQIFLPLVRRPWHQSSWPTTGHFYLLFSKDACIAIGLQVMRTWLFREGSNVRSVPSIASGYLLELDNCVAGIRIMRVPEAPPERMPLALPSTLRNR